MQESGNERRSRSRDWKSVLLPLRLSRRSSRRRRRRRRGQLRLISPALAAGECHPLSSSPPDSRISTASPSCSCTSGQRIPPILSPALVLLSDSSLAAGTPVPCPEILFPDQISLDSRLSTVRPQRADVSLSLLLSSPLSLPLPSFPHQKF